MYEGKSMASPLSVENWFGYIHLQLLVPGHESCIGPGPDPFASSESRRKLTMELISALLVSSAPTITLFNYPYGTHSSEGKGDRGKRTSDCPRTRDLRSNAEFQPRKPWRLVESLRPPLLLCTGHRWSLSSNT